MITLTDLYKYYATPAGQVCALNGISLTVEPGEIFGVIGKSGAGKSSLIRCVNLLERPDQGQVWVAGQELTQLPPGALRAARREMGMIFQHFNLLASLSVYDNIALPLVFAKTPAAQIKQKIAPLLELTGLTDKQANYPQQLSGGQKQRVAIARALVNQPKVLLCDEATSALDPETTRSILALLKDINRQLGLTILMITHEMEVIKTICSRVALLEKGEIVQLATVFDFFTQQHSGPAAEYVQAYLRQELHEVLQEALLTEAQADTNPVLRVYFKGKAAGKPLVAHLISTLHLEVNILQANIDYIQGEATGIMVMEIGDTANRLQAGIEYLQAEGLIVEKIGYVRRNAIGTV